MALKRELRRVKILLFFFRLALTLLIGCESGLCLPAAAQASRASATPPVFILPNGIRILTRERHVSPLVAIDLWVRAGSREETEAENGCAHFLEHTLFKGTQNRPAGQADSDIENLGATLTAATGPDYAHYYTTVASSHVQEALNVLADVVRNATLPAAEIERERGVILDELAAHDSNPTARLIDTLYERALPGQPYGRSPGGSPASIRLRGRDTLAAFYAHVYRPDRCALVMVGDISREQATQLAQQAFSTWQPASTTILPLGATKSPLTPSAPLLQGQASTLHAPTFDVPLLPAVLIEEQGLISTDLTGLCFPGPSAHDCSAAAAAQIIAEVLGDSRQYGRLHTANFASASVSARYTPRLDTSLWILTVQESGPLPNANRLAQLRALVLNLRVHPPTVAELQTARARALGRIEAEMETNAGFAYAVGYAEIVTGEEPEASRLRIQQITSAEIQQFLSRYLLAQPGLAVHLTPAALIQEIHP